MLMFNKQYQMEKKIIDELAKKIRKAETFYMHTEENAEVYELPGGLWVSFDLVTHELKATVGGKKIFELNCKYYGYDDGYNQEIQIARYNMFRALLERARKRLDKETKKQEKGTQKSTKMKDAKKKIMSRQEKDLNQTILQKTLKEIQKL